MTGRAAERNRSRGWGSRPEGARYLHDGLLRRSRRVRRCAVCLGFTRGIWTLFRPFWPPYPLATQSGPERGIARRACARSRPPSCSPPASAARDDRSVGRHAIPHTSPYPPTQNPSSQDSRQPFHPTTVAARRLRPARLRGRRGPRGRSGDSPHACASPSRSWGFRSAPMASPGMPTAEFAFPADRDGASAAGGAGRA